MELEAFNVQPWFVGGHNVSWEVSQACPSVRGIDHFWDEHRGLGRRGMEEVPKDFCSSILRGIVCHELSLSSKFEYDCQRNNKLVWGETIQVMIDLFDNVWGDRSEIIVDHCADITLPVCYS